MSRRLVLFACVLAVSAGCGVSEGIAPADGRNARPDAGAPDDAAQGRLDAGEPLDEADAGEPVIEPAPEPEPAPTVPPFTAPARKWTWIDVEGTKCANGSPTGVGVNLAPDSEDVLVFLQGGGACWDGASCWGLPSTAFYVATGYGRVEWHTDVQRPLMLPLRRGDRNNPFRHANIVYVPYCTGDVHSGNSKATYRYLFKDRPTYHYGSRNLGLVLDRVAATFPRIRRLWLAGDSAGGFGSALNLHRTQQRFPDTRVDVLDDSGQPIEPGPGKWEKWRRTWNVELPSDCATCEEDISGLVDYYRQKYPDNRFGLISFTNDPVITGFMGLWPTTFWHELEALAAKVDSSWPSAKYYYLPGALHVGLATPTPGLVEWLEKFATDDPTWSSHKPF